MNRSLWLFPSTRSAGGVLMMRQVAVVVSLALIAASFSATPARAEPVTIDWVTVGDPNNAADTTGYGTVTDAYRIGTYEVTIQQYTNFLNAAAKSDPYDLYKVMMPRATSWAVTRSRRTTTMACTR